MFHLARGALMHRRGAFERSNNAVNTCPRAARKNFIETLLAVAG
jgi:hypothetical protein